jgi:hypothetical protein
MPEQRYKQSRLSVRIAARSTRGMRNIPHSGQISRFENSSRPQILRDFSPSAVVQLLRFPASGCVEDAVADTGITQDPNVSEAMR